MSHNAGTDIECQSMHETVLWLVVNWKSGAPSCPSPEQGFLPHLCSRALCSAHALMAAESMVP